MNEREKSEWTPDSWRDKRDQHPFQYEDPAAMAAVTARLSELPPLVTSWEIVRLKALLADAQRGKRFLIQGGDCAETFGDCRFPVITNNLKILFQMSLI